MKKYFFTVTLTLFMMINIPAISFAESDDEQHTDLNLAQDVKSAILIEQDTGQILFDKNAHEKLPPASMVKIMTLLLTMEEIDKGTLKFDEIVRVSERAASMGGSQVFLDAGEEISVEDLVKSVAIASGNDASVALAERIAGSEEAFVEKMNDKVQELNLENTKFQNSSGLPAKEQYSTAYDMAKLSQELLKYETITNYTSIYEDYLRKGQENEFWLVNTNKLVRFYDGVDGLKTGYTSEAKYCLAATAKKDDMRVIAVAMGADTVKKRNATISQMLDYSFNHYDTEKLFNKGDVVQTTHMLKADQHAINIITNQSISVLFKKGESLDEVSTDINITEPLKLPIKKGEEIGTMTVKNGEDVITKAKLTVEEDIQPASYFTLLKRSIQKLVKFN